MYKFPLQSSILLLASAFFFILYLWLAIQFHKDNQQKTTVVNGNVVLTKKAFDDLANRAGNEKYLQDVLTGGATLPAFQHKHHIDLQPNPYVDRTNELHEPALQSQISMQHFVQIRNNQDKQHCIYQGQSYSIGEIVKVDKGWIRCTPSIAFGGNNESYYGAAIWTLRGSLL